MLRHQLIHPPLLDALATAGHGSRVLLADGNFPALTVRHPAARVVHLNLAPGLLSITEVLPVLMSATNFESAAVMATPPDIKAPVQNEYRGTLGQHVPFEEFDRFSFYEEIVKPSVGLIVATGDERVYANLLLTVGLR